jgi:hypothetical protein
VWPQHNKTRAQQQKRQQKIVKHLENEQHFAQWSVIEEIREEIKKL